MGAAARISTALIYPSASARPVVKAHVEALALSFTAIGLQTPITVKPSKQYASGRPIDAYEIVAGQHRYQAAILLKWTEIDAFVTDLTDDDAELWEIDENFARAELTDAQRADHHVRREAILVRKGLVAEPGRGGDRTSNERKVRSYSSQAADTLGVHEKTVRQDLRRGKSIDPEVLADVSGTSLDKGVVLDELASAPREDQRAKLAEITLRREEAERTRKDAEATNRATDRVIAMTDAETAAEIVLANLDMNQVEAFTARLAAVSMKDFIAALKRGAV